MFASCTDGPLPELDIGLWALAHPDTRYLGRMKAMFDFLLEPGVAIHGSVYFR